MQYSILNFLFLFCVTVLFVGIITPKIRGFALRNQIVDSPNSQHKTHKEPIPYLGGVAIILGVLMVTYSAVLIENPQLALLASTVVLPCLILGVIGLLDDLYNLSAWPRFLAQTLVGLIVASILIVTNTVGSPTGSKLLDSFVTAFFIVGLSNAINFFDNVDGGASGSVAISSFFLGLLSYYSGQFLVAGLAFIISGSTVGFLWWNRSPAKIYMGDAGSLFLGSLLASLLVRFEPNPINFPAFFFVPLFLVAIPILDTVTVVLSRILRGVSPFRGGRDHLSHRLIRNGFSKIKSVLILWALTLLYSLIALLLSNVPYAIEPLVVATGVFLWMGLLFYFFKIPATDL